MGGRRRRQKQGGVSGAAGVLQHSVTIALGVAAAIFLQGCADTTLVAVGCEPESTATNHVCGVYDSILIYCLTGRCCSSHGYCGVGAAYCDNAQTDYHTCPAHLVDDTEAVEESSTTTTALTSSTTTTTLGYGDCVGGWSVWSECSATCDMGTWSRTFVVVSPEHSGGVPCEASHGAYQRTSCNVAQCPPTKNLTPHEASTPGFAMYALFTLVGFCSAAILVWTTMLIKRRNAVVVPIPAHLAAEEEACEAVGRSYELAPPELRGWTLERVYTEEELKGIEALLKVPDPQTLGIGRDVRRGHKYNRLTLVRAWKIQKPAQKALYEALKGVLRSELAQIQACSNAQSPQDEVRTKLDNEALLLDADTSVSEKLLLHGTKPENVLRIIQNGLNERFSSGLFGQGVYLAEDASKIDQYCTPDLHYDRAGRGLNLLHGELYTSAEDHPSEVYYCFVVRAPLGRPAYTRDGSFNAAAPHESIWATADRRELVPIPNSIPPVHYHSLIAEVGAGNEFKLRRHREFVIFHGERCMLEYLLAYQRKFVEANGQ